MPESGTESRPASSGAWQTQTRTLVTSTPGKRSRADGRLKVSRILESAGRRAPHPYPSTPPVPASIAEYASRMVTICEKSSPNPKIAGRRRNVHTQHAPAFRWQERVRRTIAESRQRNTLMLLILDWCREGGSNPHDRKGRRILSPLRLPVPPSRHWVGGLSKYRIHFPRPAMANQPAPSAPCPAPMRK